MNNEDKKSKEIRGEHYVCLGGCREVTNAPGKCQTSDCLSRGQAFDKCNCADHRHHDFKIEGL